MSPSLQHILQKNGNEIECSISFPFVYPGRESNPHSRRNWILNPARLPVPPPRHQGLPLKGGANLDKKGQVKNRLQN